jgi:DNA-binding MarR family transcriptional regulator
MVATESPRLRPDAGETRPAATKPGADVGADIDAVDVDVVDVIEVASAVLVRNFELLRRRTTMYADLDRAEYLLLRTLDAVGPSDIGGLAAALGLDPSTAGRQVAVMAAKGLIGRTPSATDRRRSIISPTEAGLAKMNTTRAQRRVATEELLADWEQGDLRTLGEMFTRYNRTVAKHYLGGGEPTPPPSPAAAAEALLSSAGPSAGPR